MHMINIKSDKGEIIFNYKSSIKWFCHVIPFVILSYVICCIILYKNCYLSYNMSPVNINIYIYSILIYSIGAIMAIIFNYKNISLKSRINLKVSKEFKNIFFFNLRAILISYIFYYILLRQTQLLYWGNNIANKILETDVNSEVFKIFISIALPPDIYIIRDMIGMFLMYSLTRYLFDKSILAT